MKMTPVKIENVSTTEHHTVRLTPVNGETVDPTTLVGAALWSDDLSICLAPPPKDGSCYGTTEAVYIARAPMSPGQTMLMINDVTYGMLTDGNTDIVSYEILEDDTLIITNNTTECIRIDLGTPIENGMIDSTTFGFVEDKPLPFFEFDQTGELNAVTIHLAASRLGQVAIDPVYKSNGEDISSTIFGGQTIDLVLKTTSLLPAAGLTFWLNEVSYHMEFGQKELVIPYPVVKNTSRYPKDVTPVLMIDEPEYLLGEALPSIPTITVKPEGFNYNIPVTLRGQYVNQTYQSSTSEAMVSFYGGTKLNIGQGQEYTLQLDSSFAGTELRCNADYAINSLLGVVDSNGVCTFTATWHWTLRKQQDLGLCLKEVGNPTAFFFIHGAYAYGTEPQIYSDTLGSLKEVTGRLSTGFGNLLTVFNIPQTIMEIEISNDRWGHAGDVCTPFATPKRITRTDNTKPFEVIPDKPTALYSSTAGSMLYYLNYIQVMFVVDGVVTRQGQWFEYKLNVVN